MLTRFRGISEEAVHLPVGTSHILTELSRDPDINRCARPKSNFHNLVQEQHHLLPVHAKAITPNLCSVNTFSGHCLSCSPDDSTTLRGHFQL